MPIFGDFENIINIQNFNKKEFFKVLNFIYTKKKKLNYVANNNSDYLIENYSTLKISKKLKKMISQ